MCCLRSFKGRALSFSIPPRKSPYPRPTRQPPSRGTPQFGMSTGLSQGHHKGLCSNLRGANTTNSPCTVRDQGMSSSIHPLNPMRRLKPSGFQSKGATASVLSSGSNAAVESPAGAATAVLATSSTASRVGDAPLAPVARSGDLTRSTPATEGYPTGEHGKVVVASSKLIIPLSSDSSNKSWRLFCKRKLGIECQFSKRKTKEIRNIPLVARGLS